MKVTYYDYSPGGGHSLHVRNNLHNLEIKKSGDGYGPFVFAGREADYRAAKERINSLYGMTAYNACKPEIIFKDNGVWVTAWARWELQQMIDLCENTPGAAFVYTDTDSVKYLGDVDFSEYNKRCQDTSARKEHIL